MSQSAPLPTPVLPETTKKAIEDFLLAARSAFGATLSAAVLYGSAAEGKMRPTSDTNLILVLRSFEQTQVDALRPALRLAQSAIQLRAMFLLRDEVTDAVRSFAPKFADVIRRRALLYGEDPFTGISVPHDEQIRQLRQQLLNLTLRLRSAYAARGLREEQLGVFLASTVGTLRSLSQTFFALQGHAMRSPQEAFEQLGQVLEVPEWNSVVLSLDKIQLAQLGVAGTIPQIYMRVLDFVQKMRAKTELLGGEGRHESI